MNNRGDAAGLKSGDAGEEKTDYSTCLGIYSMSEGKTIYFCSLGCARNLVDSEVMCGILLQSGYILSVLLEDADHIIVNTCGFIKEAREDTYGEMREVFKRKKPGARVIVTGCMVKLYKVELMSLFPDIDYLLGPGDLESIVEAVESVGYGEKIGRVSSYLRGKRVPRKISTGNHLAYIKVSEGCSKRCSYCVIPKIKGALRSREISHIREEFEEIVESGVKEVVLVAQDLGDYGIDLCGHSLLPNLLNELSTVAGDYWIRLLYLYPDEVNDEVVDIISSDKRFCNYFDMPIQHVDDSILKAMRRKTDRNKIVENINMIREKLPDAVIRTNVMVGFPGEGDREFGNLVDFLKEYRIDHVGIFKYSHEKEAPSYRFENLVEEHVKEERFNLLASVQREIVDENVKGYVGKKLSVLVEGYHQECRELLNGRFYGQAHEIDPCVIISDWRKVNSLGEFYDVEITDVAEYDLIGRVL